MKAFANTQHKLNQVHCVSHALALYNNSIQSSSFAHETVHVNGSTLDREKNENVFHVHNVFSRGTIKDERVPKAITTLFLQQ